MEYELLIVASAPFEGSEFNGEDYIYEYDTDDEATLKETFTRGLNIFGIKYARLPLPVQRQMLEDTFYDFVQEGNYINITVNEL